MSIFMAFSILQEQQSQAAHFLIHSPQIKSIETKGHLQFFFSRPVLPIAGYRWE